MHELNHHAAAPRRSVRALLTICGLGAGLLCAPLPAAHAQQPLPQRQPQAGVEDDTYTFSAFPEPVELRALLEFVRADLGLSLVETDNGLQGQTVVINAPVKIKVDQVMWFLGRLLAQKGYTIVQDPTGVYLVQQTNAITAVPGDDPLSTTQIIRIKSVKPTALQGAILQITNTGAGGSPAQVAYMDDLGVLLMTGNPQQIAAVRLLVDDIEKLVATTTWRRFDLVNISASSARDRILELLGGGSASIVQPGVPGQPNPAAVAAAASSMSSLADRLTVDPQSNALLLRGRDDEAEQLSRLLPVIDVPNSLEPKWYGVGNATAEAVSSAGRRQLLGEVTVFTPSQSSSGSAGVNPVNFPGRSPLPQQAAGVAAGGFVGSGFVLYPEAGGFIYYGTPAQHSRVELLVEQLDELSARDVVVYEFYKLKHAKQEEVVEILDSLVSGQAPTATSPLLRGSDRGRNANTALERARRLQQQQQQQQEQLAPGQDGGVGEITAGDNIFVVGDEANNQVVVKAPKRLQPEFAKLINKLDLRRPQVYIQAQIVVVSETKDFRLAVEVQQIVGQWALNTNFGLGQLGTGGSDTEPSTGITQPKDVVTSLAGLTTALVRSKDVPFIINALARNVQGRIVATPQLLVDDNEEASVASLEGQPTSQTSQIQGNEQVSGFSGYEETGPKLTVTPHISDGGYLRMEYEVELSSFTGAASNNLPPPKQTNTINADSVTVPSDMTVIIGGLTFESKGNTVLKVPLLGDIPLFGHLFRDTNKAGTKRTLYVFLTPKIMRDPTFADLRLLTKGPMNLAGIDQEIPEAEPVKMVDSTMWSPPPLPPAEKPDQAPDYEHPGRVEPAPTPDPEPMTPPEQPDAMSRERDGSAHDAEATASVHARRE